MEEFVKKLINHTAKEVGELASILKDEYSYKPSKRKTSNKKVAVRKKKGKRTHRK